MVQEGMQELRDGYIGRDLVWGWGREQMVMDKRGCLVSMDDGGGCDKEGGCQVEDEEYILHHLSGWEERLSTR